MGEVADPWLRRSRRIANAQPRMFQDAQWKGRHNCVTQRRRSPRGAAAPLGVGRGSPKVQYRGAGGPDTLDSVWTPLRKPRACARVRGASASAYKPFRESSLMPDEAVVREKARNAVQQGKLPPRAPDRVWGGRGVDALCAVCEVSIPKSEMEFEVEFAVDGHGGGGDLDKFHLHRQCFAAWSSSAVRSSKRRAA